MLDVDWADMTVTSMAWRQALRWDSSAEWTAATWDSWADSRVTWSVFPMADGRAEMMAAAKAVAKVSMRDA